MPAPKGRGSIGGALRKIGLAEGDVERAILASNRSAD